MLISRGQPSPETTSGRQNQPVSQAGKRNAKRLGIRSELLVGAGGLPCQRGVDADYEGRLVDSGEVGLDLPFCELVPTSERLDLRENNIRGDADPASSIRLRA